MAIASGRTDDEVRAFVYEYERHPWGTLLDGAGAPNHARRRLGAVPTPTIPCPPPKKSDPEAPDHIEDLMDLMKRDFTAAGVGQKYVGDITYIQWHRLHLGIVSGRGEAFRDAVVDGAYGGVLG